MTYENMIQAIAEKAYKYENDYNKLSEAAARKGEGEIWGMIKATAMMFNKSNGKVQEEVNELVEAMYN